MFNHIKPEEIVDNTIKLIGADWMLITAGNIKSYNTMTANWGGLGFLWYKKISFCVIRPHRHTYEFMEKNDVYTLSFFEERYREALNICGTKSGRDINKIEETGLSPEEGSHKGVYFKEARLVLECRKIYYQDINPKNFLDEKINEAYPKKDYHRMYIGEIIDCLKKG